MTGRASRTALGVAMRRAAHQVLDHPRIFDDPLAVTIIGTEAAAESGGRNSLADRRMRAFMAARSRFAEDQLAGAIERGVRQYAVLGAGLDTYAYRSQSGVRVFEVDHPATQEWKRERLAESGIAIPDSLTFVPVDFERETLAEGLAKSSFDAGAPAFFSWLGVIMYLTIEAATATLRFIGQRPAGSGVAFDYALSDSALGPLMRMARNALAARVARAGEPFRLFFDPAQLARLLGELGFGCLEDLDARAIDDRYFAGRADGLRIGSGAAHLVCAWVSRPS